MTKNNFIRTMTKPSLKERRTAKGFTFIEVMVAIFVITVGLLAGMSAIQRAITLPILSSSRLTATYLAQEGVEIIRNIRDTNWLESRAFPNPWDEGLAGCAAGCSTDYSHSYGPSQQDPALPAFDGRPLQIDSNGFYVHPASFTETKFQRKIIITKPDADTLSVLVEINWTEKGILRSLSLRENLYDWR